MTTEIIRFEHSETKLCFDVHDDDWQDLIAQRKVVFVMDDNVRKCHPDCFSDYPVITLPAGENAKSLETASLIIDKLIHLTVNRDALLIGWGGGVICDLVGFVAGIYKRGIACAFVPTTILAMVDAAVGGKNGVNFSTYKNMVGLIRQPEFIAYQSDFLTTLPEDEWCNGFAEIIKHACIADKEMFSDLSAKTLQTWQTDKQALSKLLKRNVSVKTSLVQQDEFEHGARRILNFGHTLGHAIEKVSGLKHGFAVSVGIAFSCALSEKLIGFEDSRKVIELLKAYHLPVSCVFHLEDALRLIRADKKREKEFVRFVLLTEIGKAEIKDLPLAQIEKYLKEWVA